MIASAAALKNQMNMKQGAADAKKAGSSHHKKM